MITGKHIHLSPFDLKHKDKTRAWANDPEAARLLDRARPVSELEHDQWFDSLPQRPDSVFFAIEANDYGKHIGNVWLAGIDLRHRKAEIRILIGEGDNQNKGLGTEAIELITHYAFTKLNLHKVYAYVLSINPRARRAFEKAGFVLEGTLRQDRWSENQYIDVFLLGRIREGNP
ncbi:MAG: GNAT family N-acetyltransferase [bacterium]